MTIEEAIKSAQGTRATVEAQEFRGCKFAKVKTMTVKHLCKWVIDMGQQVIKMRQRICDLEAELAASNS